MVPRMSLNWKSTNCIIKIFVTIGSHLGCDSCADEFAYVVSRQIQILCRCAWTVVFATILRNRLFDLRARRPVIVAGNANKLRANSHGRTPRNTKVVSIGAMTSRATGFRWLLVFIVTGTNCRYENQLKFIRRLFQRRPILPRAGVRCAITWRPRIKSIKICCFDQRYLTLGAVIQSETENTLKKSNRRYSTHVTILREFT